MIDFFTSKKFILLVIIILVLVGGLGVFFGRQLLTKVSPVKLVMWGLWEDGDVMKDLIASYQKTHPNVTIEYKRQSSIQYKERLLNSLDPKLTKESDPDIARIHSSWVPMVQSLVASVPNSVMSTEEFQKTFYPTHSRDLIFNGQIKAIPLEIDGLVMYVNMKLLSERALSPATSWEEFEEHAKLLTVRDEQGKIRKSGAALGSATNVDHWQDILLTLMLQVGASPAEPNNEKGVKALSFYTGFITKNRVWDETMESSTEAFANGKVAYYFAPTWRYFDIVNLMPTDPDSRFDFQILPVLQLRPENQAVVSTYWAEAVSNKSKHKAEAFEFLKFLSSKESQTKLFTAQSQQRLFGEPYSRVDLKQTLASDVHIWPFLQNAESAKGWFLASATWDNETGVNSRVNKYYHDAVNQALNSPDNLGILSVVANGMNQVLGLIPVTPAQETQRLAR